MGRGLPHEDYFVEFRVFLMTLRLVGWMLWTGGKMTGISVCIRHEQQEKGSSHRRSKCDALLVYLNMFAPLRVRHNENGLHSVIHQVGACTQTNDQLL
jgi:hypothetical protein